MNPLGIDPIIFSLGPLQVRWYGVMYVMGFLLGGKILGKLSDEGFFPTAKENIDQLITYLLIGMFIGARITYMLVYNWDEFVQNPADLFAVWKGGLSFHGAIVGMVTAAYIFAKKHGIYLFQVLDAMGIAGSPGLLFGRLGNFINGELWGRTTDVPWAMIFESGGPYPRHPSQLYEGFGEGIVLFFLLFYLRKKVKFHGTITAMFLGCYGIIRFIIEFFRQPDAQMGFYFGGITMGQILCSIMIVVAIATYIIAKKKNIEVKFKA